MQNSYCYLPSRQRDSSEALEPQLKHEEETKNGHERDGNNTKGIQRKALKLKEWIRVGKGSKSFGSIEGIKKGVNNYRLKTQKHMDGLISLNGKLRCWFLNFQPREPVEFDYIGLLEISEKNCDFYSKCSFNEIGELKLKELSFNVIKEILLRTKRIKRLKIYCSSVSELDLSSLRLNSVEFKDVTFKAEVKLPSYLNNLVVRVSNNVQLLKANKVKRIQICQEISKQTAVWIKSLKGVKEAHISANLSECFNYLPKTVRILGNRLKFDLDNIDLSVIKKKLPFFIKTYGKMSIQGAQTLNLRNIVPIMSETEKKFTLRPREIQVNIWNVEQLNRHP